ncbi:MAG: hypothetical protein WBV59_24520, partial [Anaerolineae bacterium]
MRIEVNLPARRRAVPNVAHIQPQIAHAGVGEHKETADQTQIGNFSAFFVISAFSEKTHLWLKTRLHLEL